MEIGCEILTRWDYPIASREARERATAWLSRFAEEHDCRIERVRYVGTHCDAIGLQRHRFVADAYRNEDGSVESDGS
jgi:hypothetical protein